MAKAQPGATPSTVLGHEATHIQTTATDKTLERYAQTGDRLFHRYLRESGIPHEKASPASIDARLFIRWAFALKATLKPASWRSYRASLHHYLEQYVEAGSNITDAQDMLARDAAIRSLDAVRGNRISRTATRPGSSKQFSSSLKMKKIPHNDLTRLLPWLQIKSRSKWAQATSTWISAGILCGLRPCEWERTLIKTVSDNTAPNGRRIWLFVICAKATNGRGFGVSRSLDISSFDHASLSCVTQMVERAAEWRESGTFQENQKTCAQLLYNANRALWPQRKLTISLYSARHQAIANWKHAGLDLTTISVLAGHASPLTSSENYGRRTSGWNGVTMIPVPAPDELKMAMDRKQDIEIRNAFIKKATPVHQKQEHVHTTAPVQEAPAPDPVAWNRPRSGPGM